MKPRSFQVRSWLRGGLGFVGACAALVIAPGLHGHEGLMTSVLHEVGVVVGATNLDVTVELTFREAASFAERRALDGNRDGRLAPGEIRRYLAAHEREWEEAVTVTVMTDGNGRPDAAPKPLSLVLLHNPELDLRGVTGVGLACHTLRLEYFVRTPPGLKPGDRLLIEDRLWAHLPTQNTFRSTGRDGWLVEAETGPASARAATNGVAAVRCTARVTTAGPKRPTP